MQGFIVTYSDEIENSEVTKINHHLFGRVSKSGEHEYYYPGELEDTEFFKLSDGCYFVRDEIDDCDGLLDLIPAELYSQRYETMTARDTWNKKLGSKSVKNFSER